MDRTIVFAGMILTAGLSSLAGFGKEDAFPDLSGWEKAAETREFFPADLFDYINGAADAFLSYDFEHLQVKEYHKGSDQRIKAEIYEHKDADHAFGIYSIERSHEYNFLNIGAQAYHIEDILNMVCGKYYVKIQGYGLKNTDYPVIIDLAKKLAFSLGKETSLPAILDEFPERNKRKNSEIFVAKNFLGFDFLENGYAAVYVVDEHPFQLFVMKAANREEARRMLEAYVSFTRQDKSIIEEGYILIQDRYNGDLHVLWDGKYILGTVECMEKNICLSYLNDLHKNIID